MSTNDITGDRIVSKKSNANYESGFDKIFGKKKPTVQYIGDVLLRIGCWTFVHTLDHPNTNTPSGVKRTSRVVSFDNKTGDFETENTKYVKVQNNA